MAEHTDEEILQQQVSRLAELVTKLVENSGSNVQTISVIHKTEGTTPWQAAAVTASFASIFFSLLVYLILTRNHDTDVTRLENQLRDHDAYIHVQGNDIAKLKNKP